MRSKSWAMRLTAIRFGIATLHASSSKAAVLTLHAGSIVLMGLVVSPGQAQLPSLKDLNLQPSNLLEQKSDNQVVSGCIRLNGRCVFKIADQKSDLPNRINDIEQRLNNISRLYFKNNTSELKIRKQTEGRLPNITIPNSEIKVVANLSSSWSRADLTKCEREIPLSRRHWGMKANQWCGEA